MSSKPTYVGWAANSPRRAHVRISTHDYSLRVRQATIRETNTTKTNPHVLVYGPRPLQCDGHTLGAPIGGFLPLVSTDGRSVCADLPRQGRPLLLGEWSGCTQNDVRPIQGSMLCGNQPFPQLLQAPLVLPASATIAVVREIVQSHVVDVEVGDGDNHGAESSASPQCFGSQQPACFGKQLSVAHIPSPGLQGSRCPSLEFVAPDGCCAPLLGSAHGARSWGADNNAADPLCGGFHTSTSGHFAAIRIPSKKLACVNRSVLATRAQTWVVGHVLENYTCLSSGRDLYDADFGDSYGHQTVLVGDSELLCDIE